eukprot:8577165-Ditylum_brightwellii.AAC.1
MQYQFHEKVDMENIAKYFKDLDDVFVFDESNDNMHAEEMIHELDKDFSSYKVILMAQRYPEYQSVETVSKHLTLSGCNFELCAIVGLINVERRNGMVQFGVDMEEIIIQSGGLISAFRNVLFKLT